MENRIKAFIDTNILLDYMIPSREGHDVVVNLFSLILTAKIEAAFSTQSILDAVYIGRKLPDFPEAFSITENSCDSPFVALLTKTFLLSKRR